MRRFDGRVRFAVENYGDSPLAERFGVTRYPAIFVDDILVATPKDFGFYGQGEGERAGRYAPWRDATSHEKFRTDLARMVGKVLAGKSRDVRAETASVRADAAALAPARMPRFSIATLDGGALDSAALAGRPVLIEFWATWCPPCRGTLAWLGELKRRHGDRLEVVALALESDPTDVQKVVTSLGAPLTWAMSSADLARSFGDLSAVPTLFLFDADGKTVEIFYGAPPDLHQRVERALATLLP